MIAHRKDYLSKIGENMDANLNCILLFKGLIDPLDYNNLIINDVSF